MSDDPLDGAEAWETREVTHEQTHWHLPPEVFDSDDRMADYEITDVEAELDADGDAIVTISWSGEVTRLPPRESAWIFSPDAPTLSERRKAQRRDRWVSRIGRVLGIGIPVGVSMFVAVHVMNATAGALSINGETVGPMTFADVAPVMAFILIFAAVIQWGLLGGFPRMGGVHR